jgi:MFS family permease
MFTNPTYLQIFLTISLPIMGLAYALVGGLKLSLVERLQIDEGKVGKLVGGFGTMFGPTILLCGFLTDALGRKGVWVAGSAAVAAAVLIFALTRTFRGAFIAVLLLGVGWAAQVNVGNVLMRVAIPPDRPQSELVWAANFFDFVFGLGALVTPMVLGILLKKLDYSKGLIVLAVIAALPMVLGIFAQMNPDPPAAAAGAAAAADGGMSALVRNPLIWVLGFAFLFFVPLETSVAGWATTLIQRQTPTEVPPEEAKKFASFALSAFWFGFTGSRLVVSILGAMGIMTKILGQTNEQRLLVVMAIACIVIMLSLALLKGRQLTFSLILLAGMACGPVFPTMMAVVLLSVPADTMGRAVGFFFFFASIGWTVVPMLIGYVARKADIQKGFLVAAGSGAVFFVLILIKGMMAAH